MSQAKRLKTSSIKSYFKRREGREEEVPSTSHLEDDGNSSSALGHGGKGCGDPIENAPSARNYHDDIDWTSPNQPPP